LADPYTGFVRVAAFGLFGQQHTRKTEPMKKASLYEILIHLKGCKLIENHKTTS